MDATDTRQDRRDRHIARAASLLLTLTVLSPAVEHVRDRPRDGFPLSHFPMFSEHREPIQRLTYLVGIGEAGERRRLPYTLAGAGGLNQVRKQVDKRARTEAGALCADVASRVAERTRPPYAGVREVRVVTGTYEIDEYFAGRTAPLKEVVRAQCTPRRGTPQRGTQRSTLRSTPRRSS